jgi:uncharacterized membrane protein
VSHPELLRSGAGRVAAAILAGLAVVTLAGVIAMWPGDDRAGGAVIALGRVSGAEVTRVSGESSCVAFAGPQCRLVHIRLLDGPSAGRSSTITLPGGDELAPKVEPGDRIRVARNATAGIDPALVERLPIDDPSQQPFAFVDFERRGPLIALAVAFALLVLVLGRSQGARSLIGLGLSLLVVVKWLVPSILDGHPPLLVAMVGALAVMLLTIAIAHGPGIKSAAAMLGTAGALTLTALLALLGVKLAHITGLGSEQSTLLFFASGRELSLEGLVLAGVVVGALGVLDDVTVSQASTVLALRRANHALAFRRLTSEALLVGRDHLGATVNTLVLAYAGAALPVLLIFANQQTSVGEAVNREPVASEIVAMLVGSIGLIAAVPLTTALAAALAVRIPPDRLPADTHAGHAH